VRHPAEVNFQDEADTWWVPTMEGGLYGHQTRLITASRPGSGRLVEVVLLDAKANQPSDRCFDRFLDPQRRYGTELCPIPLLPPKNSRSWRLRCDSSVCICAQVAVTK
jgi:hypothetical protein